MVLNITILRNKSAINIDILFVTIKLENCPFTVLEAKSVGIPTVTISEGGISEIIKHKFIANNGMRKIHKLNLRICAISFIDIILT